MLPRHAWSRVAAPRVSKSLRRTRPASTAAAPVTSARINAANSAMPNDTNLRAIFDEPFSNTPSPSASLTPTGLFGNATLRSPDDFISLAHATIEKAKVIVARITKAPEAGLAEMRMVVQNFDRLSDVLCSVIDTAELVRHAHPDPQWAEASNEAYEMLCSYMNVLNTHTSLYQVRPPHHASANHFQLTEMSLPLRY
jgi:intermediate peptidase